MSSIFAKGSGFASNSAQTNQQLESINSSIRTVNESVNLVKDLVDSIKANTLNIKEIERLRSLIPPLSFASHQIYTSSGFAGFVHWIEPLPKHDKLLIPASFLTIGASTGFAILLSDDGINFREVYKSPTATENYALNAKDRGDMCFISTGSGVASNIVGSLYRSQDGGETWTKQLTDVDNRIYPIEITRSGAVVVGTTNNGAESATSGKIKRSVTPSTTPMVWTDALVAPHGIRSIVGMKSTGTLLAGFGHPNGGGIYRSTNDGVSWQLMKTMTVVEGKAVYWFHEDIDPLTSQVRIYAGTVSSQIFESLDDGVTWTNVMNLTALNATFQSVLRRTIEYDGRYYAATQFGFYIIDFPNRIVKQFFNDIPAVTNSQVFYNVAKLRGGLVLSFDNKIAYSGNIQPCAFNLWSAKDVTTGTGLTTSHFSTKGHNRKSALIFSTQSGTLTVQLLDRAGATPTMRDMAPTVAITANTATVIDLGAYMTAGGIFAIKFVPSVNAVVNVTITLD